MDMFGILFTWDVLVPLDNNQMEIDAFNVLAESSGFLEWDVVVPWECSI